MNFEKVLFGFFILLAATLNFGFVVGAMDRVDHHNVFELAAALVVSLIATVLKFGDRTQLGAVHLATSLVADLQLIASALYWTWTVQVGGGMTGEHMSVVVSLATGALVANVMSVVLMVTETLTLHR